MNKSKKGVRGLLCAVLVSMLFLTCMVTSVPVYATTSGDDSSTVGDLYDVTTALTAYVNNVVGANGNDKHNNQRVENPLNVGNAGAYVGYGDEKNDFVAFITANTTIGASASTYDAWEGVIDGAGSDYAYAYVRLGKTLQDAGLDESVSSSGGNMIRYISGGVSFIFWIASEFVPTIFEKVLSVLKMLNVFQLFGNAVINLKSYWMDAFKDSNSPTISALTPLVNFISDLYSYLYLNITWVVVVPLLIAFTVFSVLVLRKQASTKFGNLIKRLVFLAVGLPICAGLYTSALNQLTNVALSETATSKLVAASFVDFESWASNNLNITNSFYITSSPNGTDGAINDGGVASADTLKRLRTTALEINKAYSSGIPSNWSLSADSHTALSGSQWNMSGTANTTTTTVTAQESIRSLLTRYFSNDVYDSATWATKIADYLDSFGSNAMGDSSSTDTDTIRAMYDSTDEVSDWMNREETDNSYIWRGSGSHTDTAVDWASNNFNIFNDGNMTANGSTTSDMYWRGKLSSLSMYNYLSTSFGDSSLVVYSNSTSVSEHTKMTHASVTSTGNGLLGVLFMVNMWACLIVVAVIGCYFALSMTFKNIKTGVRLLASVPMATLGAIKSIAQVIIYTVTMIGELILGAFMYSFVSEFLMVCAAIVENLVARSTGFSDGSTNLTVLFGGYVGAFGLNLDPSVMYHSYLGICCMILVEIALVLCVGTALWKYRRAIVRVYGMAAYRVYRLMTCKAFQEEFERVWNGGRVRVPVPNGLQPVPVCSAFADVIGFLKVDKGDIRKEVMA